jgi:hypothetical protein
VVAAALVVAAAAKSPGASELALPRIKYSGFLFELVCPSSSAAVIQQTHFQESPPACMTSPFCCQIPKIITNFKCFLKSSVQM